MLNFNQVEISVYYTPADITHLYQDLKAIGANRLRILAAWADIETVQGKYTWSGLDAAITPAGQYGVRPLICISTPMPAWASPESYGALCAAIAKRYGPLDYEIFNEMNNSYFFPPASAAVYVQYLQAAYTAIKAVQPGAAVIFGGVAATVAWFGLIESVDFVKQAYAAGAKGYFDALAYHPYTGSPSTFIPDDPTETEQFIADSDDIYVVMVAHGDGHLKMWWTEFGFSTENAAQGVTQAVQAKWLADEHALGISKPYLEPTAMFVYNYRDSGTDGTENNTLGVVDFEWNHKLAWTTIQAINASGDSVTPEQAAQLAQILENQATILANQATILGVVRDNQIQLRGPNLKGWPQLGQNAAGEDLTLVDAFGVMVTAVTKK